MDSSFQHDVGYIDGLHQQQHCSDLPSVHLHGTRNQPPGSQRSNLSSLDSHGLLGDRGNPACVLRQALRHLRQGPTLQPRFCRIHGCIHSAVPHSRKGQCGSPGGRHIPHDAGGGRRILIRQQRGYPDGRVPPVRTGDGSGAEPDCFHQRIL